MTTPTRRSRAGHPQGSLHELLLRLYAFGPAPILRSKDWRRDWRLAWYALSRGLVQLADGEGPLERHPSRILQRIQLAAPGRLRLNLPLPAPLGDRLPLAILHEAVTLFLRDAPEVEPDPTGWLLARVEHRSAEPIWEARVVAAARYATERGVPCAPVIDEPNGRSDFVLLGYETIDATSEGGPS